VIKLQLETIDWAVLVVYLVVIAVIGIVAGLRIRGTDHYFLGGRGFGPWLMIGQSFGIGTHAEMPVSLAGAVYTSGFSGIWYQWKNLFATPFYWLIAPLFRRMRRTTIGEVVEDRYGPWMGVLYTVFALAYFTINMASMLKGAGKVISQAGGGAATADQIVYAMTVVFLLYSFIGGLLATAWTDFAQSFLILALSFMLIPLGWNGLGGLEGMKQVLDPHFFSLATPQGIGVWFIFLLTINGLIGIISQPHQLAAVGTGKDEHTCRQGMFYGNYVKRFCTVGWAVVGLMVAAMIAAPGSGFGKLADPEDAFGFACRQLLFPGGLGLLIASVLAANMSTCSAMVVDSGALVTRNIYQRFLVRHASDRHYLWAGRFGGLLLTLLGVVYAVFLIDKVLHSFLLTETMATYMGISIFGGILWRRANRWGALASLMVALGVNFALLAARGERLDYWDPNVFGISLLSGIVALIAVSLMTRREPEQNVAPFFARLAEPVPGTAPAGARLLLAEAWQFLRRPGAWGQYREDLAGFARGWLLVLGLVLLTWLWLRS
jgi:Na+/proline symporter